MNKAKSIFASLGPRLFPSTCTKWWEDCEGKGLETRPSLAGLQVQVLKCNYRPQNSLTCCRQPFSGDMKAAVKA